MSKTASEISRGTEVGQAWADVMGMSIEEVATLMEEDAYGALIKMVEGLEDVDESGGNLDQTLRDLGINEIRQLDVMKRLVGSSGDLAEAQKMANGEWEANNALVEESAARYETLESKMQIIKNSIDNIFSNMGNAFAQSSEGILSKITDIIQEVDRMTDSFFDSNGAITETGEKFVDTATKIAEVGVVLGTAGAAFMAFGPGGAVAVAVIAGLAAIGIEAKDLYSYLSGTEAEKSMYRISEFSEGATEEAATNYVDMKDGILRSLGELSMQSGEEASKTRQNIVKEFEALASEAVTAIEGKRSQMNSMIDGLMVDATEPQRRALEKARTEANRHYNEQIEMTQDFAATINEVMTNMVDENGQITAEGMRNFETAASGLDEVFGTAIAESATQMQRFKSEFDTAFSESDINGAQDALTGMAKNTAAAMRDLKKVYEEQVDQTQALGLEKEAEELILAGLEDQYNKNTDSLLDNLIATEELAQGVDGNISATKDLSDAEKTYLGLTNEKTKALREAEGATLANEESITSLDQAQEKVRDSLAESTGKFNELATEMNKIDESSKTVSDALKDMSAAVESEAQELGKSFATNFGDGTEMVDMGTYGKLTVDQFVRGVRSGEIGVTEASIALINRMRNEVGKEPLTPEGQAAAESYAEGIMSEEATVESVAKALGYATAEGVKIDLGEHGIHTIETFVSGLRTGEFSMFEVMQALMNNLETLSQKDLSEYGAQDMATLAAGLESGLLDVNEVMDLMGESLQSDAQVDLGEQGIHTIGTWVEALSAGQIDVETFMSGLESIMKEGLNIDLAENGERSMASYTEAADAKAQQFINESLQGAGTQIKEALNIDLTPEGESTGQSFNTGFLNKKLETDALTQQFKTDVESKLGETSDGGGGVKAPTDFSTGFINSMPWVMSLVQDLTGTTESTLGSTTDGGGGASAIGAFASGLLTNSGTAETNASSVSTSVENTLSNTSDGSGGLNATGAFASGILANLVRAQSAANSASGAVQNALSTTTDGGGGANAGAAFSSGVLGSIATATGAANSAKLGVQGTLGTTTDGGGGLRAGSIFSGGLASTIGAVTGSANSAKNSVQTTLGSTTDSSGGQKAGSMFAGGIRSQIGAVQSAANTNKTNVERTLGSTTDSRGGNRAGTMFVSGIRSQIGAATSAANSNKSNVESTLGSTTDNGGGNKAGNMFVSGVKSHTGAASGAGNQVSSSARSGLSNNSNTFSLGADFGSGFVRGISSYVGAAARAAANLVASALSAIKRRQNSNSPAKETMKLGDDFGDGFALAIVDKTREAVSAARNMARDAINAAGDESVKNSLAVDVGGFNGSLNAVNSRVTHELEATSRDRALAQPMQLTTVIGGQEFETFSDNIYAQNTKSANFKDNYRG